MRDCVHAQSRLVKVVATNGVVTFACECIRCGRLATEWIPPRLIRFPEAVAIRGSKLPTVADQMAEAKREIARLKNEAWVSLYRNYLESPQWQILRRSVFNRCNGICEHCGKAKATQAHHLTYERLGNERLEDLLAVCLPCHESIHQRPLGWEAA